MECVKVKSSSKSLLIKIVGYTDLTAFYLNYKYVSFYQLLVPYISQFNIVSL